MPSEPEALAMIELSSIAAGTRAADALIKKAPVRIERVGTLQPGIFAILWSGDVASVQESLSEALRVGGDNAIDHVLLPHVEPSVYRAALGEIGSFAGDCLGLLETAGMARAIDAADAAVKGANVAVVRIRLGDELHGKGLVHVMGEQHDVEAAVALGAARAHRPGISVQTSVTPRIDRDLLEIFGKSTRFWESG